MAEPGSQYELSNCDETLPHKSTAIWLRTGVGALSCDLTHVVDHVATWMSLPRLPCTVGTMPLHGVLVGCVLRRTWVSHKHKLLLFAL
jgi:hypothetical protein